MSCFFKFFIFSLFLVNGPQVLYINPGCLKFLGMGELALFLINFFKVYHFHIQKLLYKVIISCRTQLTSLNISSQHLQGLDKVLSLIFPEFNQKLCFSLIFTSKRLCFPLSFRENGYLFQDSTSHVYSTYLSIYIYIYLSIYLYICCVNIQQSHFNCKKKRIIFMCIYT